jgi:SAM-dependent methyltransferase
MSNEQQIAYWNGDAGRKWAERDSQMASMLAPIAEALMDHARVDGARAVLDVGCGGGSETLMLAQRLGPDACILGVDVSEPMLEVAKQHLESVGEIGRGVGFLQADASSHDFAEQQFDLLFSRFGVMFFDQPTAAFAKLRSAMLPEGRLAFACWQALASNPWTALPLKAALTVLPPPPKPEPRAPGPFAFADPDYVTGLLSDAGWQDISITPHAVTMRWDGSAGFENTVRELVNTGPVGRLLADVDRPTRDAVHAAAADVLKTHFKDDALALPGAVWLVTAKNR